MKLGKILEKERKRSKLSLEEAAARLGIPEAEYRLIEAGDSEAEIWGPALAEIAVALATPTSRLLAESGRAADAATGRVGELIKAHRERRGKSASELAGHLGLTVEEYEAIECGRSPIETWGPLLLRFAEMTQQPVFNFFYPCGVPAALLTDYP